MSSEAQDAEQACVNTDREIWREREGDYYADSIHVTEAGTIGINCGGTVFTLPVREWHRFAAVAPDMAEALDGIKWFVESNEGVPADELWPAFIETYLPDIDAALSKAHGEKR